MPSSDLQGKPEYPSAQQAFICFKKGHIVKNIVGLIKKKKSNLVALKY